MAADRKGRATRADYITRNDLRWRAYAKEIGVNVRRRRTVLDISAAELCAALGVQIRVIRYWESGKNAPQLPMLFAISIALRCDLRELMPPSTPAALAAIADHAHRRAA